MEYEIYLTTKCTRNCAFCYVDKHEFVETLDNARKFVNYIKQHERFNSNFTVNLFGGEPTLAIELIIFIFDELKHYKNAHINLITNGDILESLQRYAQLQSLNIFLTPYDIFSNTQKYANLIKHFPIRQIQYTFTEDDIDMHENFSSIAYDINIPYKIRFSTDPQSWKAINKFDLHEKIFNVMRFELDLLANRRLPAISLLPLPMLSRLLIATFNYNAKHHSCLDIQKMSFYNGEFYGKCIRFQDKNVDENYIPQKCKSCEYFLACDHSCHAELVDGQVNEKLCIIKKAQFDAIIKYVYNKKYNNNISQILKYLLKENNLLYK